MTSVFISHATPDGETVDKIAAVLKTAGIDTWVDHQHGIEQGDIWPQEIQDAVNVCDYGLFVLSPRSVKSEYCLAEWNRILALDKKLYIAQIETVPLKDYPLRLGIIQYSDLAADFDAGMAELIRAINGKTDLDLHAPTVKTGKRITSSYDDRFSLYSIPMQGRDDDLAKALDDLKRAPLFIVGVGGLGKSRLAAEIMQRGSHTSAIWQRATDTSSAGELYERLREHYSLDPATPPNAVIQHVRSESGLLVVIDNAEAIPDAARTDYQQAADLLANAGASVLVTTRVMDWPIPRLKRQREPSKLDPAAAAQVVQAMADQLGIERDTAPFAQAMAEAAHLHPRLIELAVGKLSYEPPSEILRELKTLSRDTDEALTEMIRRTVDQMATHTPDAPGTLKRLAVTRGGFTLAAAQAISGISDRDTLLARLKTLTDYRFVRFDLASERYSIDELVMLAVGEDESAHRQHYNYYFALAQLHDQRQDYYGLDVESANLEVAFEWAIENDAEDALWLFNACTFFLRNRGRFAQRLDWIERVVKALEGASDELRANAQNSLGVMYQNHPFGERRANLRRAVDAFQQALKYATPKNTPLYYAMTQSNLGIAYATLAALEDERSEQQASLHRAVEAFQEALNYLTPQTALTYAGAQNNLGAAYRDLAALEDRAANLRRALVAYRQALTYRTPQTAPLDHAMTQYNLGAAYRDLAALEDREGNLRPALEAFQEALKYRTPQTAPLDYAKTQQGLGVTYNDLGDLAAAVICWREAEKYFRQMSYVDDADMMLRWIVAAEQAQNNSTT